MFTLSELLEELAEPRRRKTRCAECERPAPEPTEGETA